MLIKIITPLPKYKLLDYSYGFEIDKDIFYIRAPALTYPDVTQLQYADKETLTVYPICCIFGSTVSFPAFELNKQIKSTIQYDDTNSVLFTIPDKITDLTGLPTAIRLHYSVNRVDETFIEFFKLIAIHFPLFKNYEKDIQEQITALLPDYSDYRLNHIFIPRVNKLNISDYITAVEENIRNFEYSIRYYTDSSVFSIETRKHNERCLISLNYTLSRLRYHSCALNA